MFRLFIFRLLESYLRHRWLYLVPVLVLLVSGIAFVTLSKPKYTAQGILYIQKDSYLSQLTAVRSSDGSWWASASQITSDELGSLLQTDAFVRAIIRNTSLEEKMEMGPEEVAETIEEVRKSVWVHPMGDKQIFIGATYEDPEISVNLVNGIINDFLHWKANGERTDSEVALSFFNDLIGVYRTELDSARMELHEYLEAYPEPVRGARPILEQMEISRIQRDIDRIESRFSAALEKEENARLSIAQVESDIRQTYIVIDAPHLPFKKANSRREMLLTVAIFLGVGMLLSGGGLVGSAVLDRSFRAPVDVQQKLSLPVLAMIPDFRPTTRKRPREGASAKAEVAKQTESELPMMEDPALEDYLESETNITGENGGNGALSATEESESVIIEAGEEPKNQEPA
jgi:capsular polysaccharide biosynthesis protein